MASELQAAREQLTAALSALQAAREEIARIGKLWETETARAVKAEGDAFMQLLELVMLRAELRTVLDRESATSRAADAARELLDTVRQDRARLELRMSALQSEMHTLRLSHGAQELDALRYRRLRVLGVAPDGTKHLREGCVMRFTNLDEFVDHDIRITPSRGEAITHAESIAQEGT